MQAAPSTLNVQSSTLDVATAKAVEWHGPGARTAERRSLNWHSLLWTLVFPKKRHRIALTVPGLFLMALAMGIGSAAYNTSSNILFITLSLLLACLLGRLKGLPGEEAIRRLRLLRPALETPDQERFVASYLRSGPAG